MRQIAFTRYGAQEVLALREQPTPAPSAGEVRIAVRAADVNFADILARIGLYPDAPSLPVIAKPFPLELASEAHRYVQSRANIGKVVLTM